MSAVESAEARAPHPLWVWFKKKPLESLPFIGFILAVGSFAWIAFPAIARGNGPQLLADLIAHSYVLVWMLILSTTVRTIGVRQVMTLFLSGFFLSTAIAILVSRPLLDWLGSNNFTVAFWVPLVEELAKIIPLLFFVWANHRRRGQMHGVSELVILGFAVGAGMAVHEDIFYGRAIVSRSGETVGAFLEPWGFLFPSFYSGPGGSVVGHAGWGAIIGLGLAFSSIYLRQKVLALCFLIGGLFAAFIDHASMNMRGDFAGLVSMLALNNNLALVLFILGFPLAVIYDLLRRRHRPPHLPQPNFQLYRSALGQGHGWWERLVNFLALGHYRRGWTAAAYARATAGNQGDDYPRLMAWYRILTRRSVSPDSHQRISPDPEVHVAPAFPSASNVETRPVLSDDASEIIGHQDEELREKNT